MDRPHPASLGDDALLASCQQSRGRTSGPGGQHRNKVETHMTLTHRPTAVTAQAGERRSQADNKRVALFRLRLALALAVRTERDGPSVLWESRCRGGRIAVNPKHRDFPALVAEALDQLASFGWVPRDAAEVLGCSPTQLIKLCKQHPPAFERWNTERAALGLRPLH